MEPCAPGTEDEDPITYASLNKGESERDRLLNQKAVLKNGKYTNIFECTYEDGMERWYCRACECPVMGKPFQHEGGRRHSLNVWSKYPEKEHRQEEESKEEDVIEVAPGEPLPPGFEESAQLKSHIQERLDGFKVGPLVALEYLVELHDDDASKEPFYLCILCDKRGDPRTVLTHLASYNHISKYLQRHFPTCFRALAPYSVKQYKRNWQNTLQKIAEAIEKKFGRLKPFPIEKRKFDLDRMTYLHQIGRGKHFNESKGNTFEELIVRDELIKVHEDEKQNDKPVESAAVIQKPFRKKSPSPPKVAAPTIKRMKESGQTMPTIRNKPALETSSGNKSSSANTVPSVNNPQTQVNQRSRKRSLSSVSSASSGGGGGGRVSPPVRNIRERSPQARGRNLPYKRRRSPSPRRRSPSPRHRLPSPRRKLPSPRRKLPSPRRKLPSPRRKLPSPRHRSPFQRRQSPSPTRDYTNNALADINKALEKEKEKLRKVQEFRKLSRAIETDLQKTLKVHEKNPEKHPQYNEEWKKFWNKRYKELQAQGVDVSKHDFKPEWIIFWNKRMIEIHSDELKSRKDALRKRLALPDELNPIKFKINAPQTAVSKVGPNLPVTALSDQENDVIIIDDKDDEKPRSNSPWEHEISSRSKRSPVRRAPARSPIRRAPARSPVRRAPARSPLRRSPVRRSPVRSPVRRSPVRSPVRRSPVRSPMRRSPVRKSPMRRSPIEMERNIDFPFKRSMRKSTSPRRSRERSHSRNRSRSRNLSHSRNLSWNRSPDRRTRSRSRETLKSRNRRSVSGERGGYERRVRESSFERDMRAKERVRTVADLPWEREKAYRMPYDHFYDSKMMIPRKPLVLPEPVMLPPEEEEEDNGEVNVVDVLRILTALEDKLGSLGPKVNDLLAQALALEKKEANSSETLLDNDINCVLFETTKEKLKGQLLAGLVDPIQARAFKKAIKKAAALIHLASQRKSHNPKSQPKKIPVSVPGVGTVDKAAIAKQIANALVAQGKTDVTQAELEQLIDAVVGMAEASKNSNKPITTASFLQQIAQGSISTDVVPNKKDEPPVEKFTEPLTPSPRNNSPNMDNLSDSDLKTLLQNFKDLSTDEQHNLINYLKKLEFQEPERVEKLRQFVDLESAKASESSEKTKKDNRESPFSERIEGVNPASDDLVRIESEGEEEEEENIEEEKMKEKPEPEKIQKIHADSEDEDYSFEDVVKSVSKNVKDKELQSNMKIVEQSMKFDNLKTKAEFDLNNAKDLISNLMSNISKSNINSSRVGLLGFGESDNFPSSTSNDLNNSEFAKTLSNLNVSNLTNIVNSVKKFENSSQKTEAPKSFATNPNAGKLNFDPSQLNKPRSPMMHGTFDGSQVSQQMNQRRFGPDNGPVGSGMERGSIDMGRGSMDMGRGFIDMGRGSIDMGRGSVNMGRGSVDMGRGSFDMGRGSFEMGRGSVDMGRGSVDMGRGSVDMGRGSVDTGRGSVVMGRGSFDMGRGSMDMGRGSVDMGRGSVDMGRGSFDMDNFDIDRGSFDMDRGSVDKVRGSVDMARGSVDTARGSVDTGRGSVDMGRGSVDMGRGSVDMGRGSVDMGRGSVDMGRGSIAMDRGSSGINRSAMGMAPMTDRGGYGYDNRFPESDNYSPYSANSGQSYPQERDPAFYPVGGQGYTADRGGYGKDAYGQTESNRDRYSRPTAGSQFRSGGFDGRDRPTDQYPRPMGNAAPNQLQPRGQLNQRNDQRFNSYDDNWY